MPLKLVPVGVQGGATLYEICASDPTTGQTIGIGYTALDIDGNPIHIALDATVAAGNTILGELLTQAQAGATAALQTAGNLGISTTNTNLGAPSDAAWSGSGAGSLIAIAKAIWSKLSAGIAVTGTFWQATQPVSAVALPLPTGAAQESGGNLAATAAAAGTTADAAYGGSGTATVVAALKGIYAKLGAVAGAVTQSGTWLFFPGKVTPVAGSAAAITTGGTAVTLVTGPCNGGWITNPPNAASQGIATAENVNVDMVGTPSAGDSNGNGTATLLAPGQTLEIPPLATGQTVKANASTSGHKLTVVVL